MRRMGALFGVCAAVALPLGGGPAQRPLPLRGPEAATAPLTALVPAVAGGQAMRLAQLDPRTLAVARASRELGPVEAWARSPDRRLLALGVDTAGSQSSATLRFANVLTLRVVRRGVHLDGALRAAAWPTPGRLVAVVDDGSGSGLAVETVDTVAKRVVARHALAGTVGAVARSADGLVLLVERANAVAPATLATVDGEGAVRTVGLGRIRAGWSWPADAGNDPIGATRSPGLAVDPAGTAYVLDAGGFVAAVDLSTLAVSYHALASRSLLARLAAWLTPAAQAKGMNGPVRTAAWLGDGLIALTGSDYAASRGKDGAVSFAEAPAGLAVVDTRDWTSRVLGRDTSDAAVADGALLATGGSWSSNGSTSTSADTGLAAYGADGSLRWRLFPGRSAWIEGVVGALALVQVDSKLVLVDVAGGRELPQPVASVAPQLLVGAGS